MAQTYVNTHASSVLCLQETDPNESDLCQLPTESGADLSRAVTVPCRVGRVSSQFLRHVTSSACPPLIQVALALRGRLGAPGRSTLPPPSHLPRRRGGGGGRGGGGVTIT